MNIEGLATSDYLGGDDMQHRQITVTIAAAELKKYDDGSQKVVLSFSDHQKKLTLNKTRLKTMMSLFGPETDKWINKKITLVGQPLSTGRFAGQWTIIILQSQQNGNDDSLGFMDDEN